MKKIGLVAAMIGVFATAQAQQRPASDRTPSERAERQTAALAEALDLTEEQQSAVEKINLEYAEEMTSLREKNREVREEARAAMKEMKEKKDAELKDVLTEEQIEKYKAHREKRKEHRGRRKHRG